MEVGGLITIKGISVTITALEELPNQQAWGKLSQNWVISARFELTNFSVRLSAKRYLEQGNIYSK